MPLPKSPRVLYAKTPLENAICQFRFPPVLRIDSEVPAAFQERIRATFPLYQEEDGGVALTPEMPPDMAQIVRATLSQHGVRPVRRFLSADSKWTVALARDFLALSSSAYTRWEDFRARLARLLEALLAEYNPGFFTRLGLRYQNVIVRSRLGLDEVSWSELLAPHVAAEFSSSDVSSAISEAAHRILIDLPEAAGKVNLRHGTARKPNSSEVLYSLDWDFFAEDRTEATENVLTRLDRFNAQAARLFRWCISTRLHDAMEPSPLD